MPVLGLISEYNPFHNGHLYHFNTSRDITQAEYSICILSGNFVQRGEPAIVDKWSRTMMALKAGIDLIIELPIIYCAQSAEIFAFGAISLLNKLGIVDSICFGSECGDINILKEIAYIIAYEPDEYKAFIKEGTQKGLSFAAAREKAVIRYIDKCMHKNIDTKQLKQILQSSNNILALEYIKWLLRLNSKIVPLTIKRIHSGYNDKSLDKPIASATAIRSAIEKDDYEILNKHMPDYAVNILREQFNLGRGPVSLDDFTNTVLCNLRRMKASELSALADVSEGLEYRIKKASISSFDIEGLIQSIKSKRYAQTRIQRIIINSLLLITKNDLDLFKTIGPQYVRVLGFSEKGRKLISAIKKSCDIPLITNVSGYKKYGNEYLNKMIEMDILSTDVYVTAYKKPELKYGGQDFYIGPVTI